MARQQHESAAVIKRRELTLAHWQASLLRAGSELSTFQTELRRALADPLVRSDPELQSQIQAFAALKLNELRRAKSTAESHPSTPHVRSESHPALMDEHQPTEEEVRAAARRLLQQFETYATHYFEPESNSVLERLLELHSKHPEWVKADYIEHCRYVAREIRERRQNLNAHIQQLTTRLFKAAETGAHDDASKILQRLSTIHTMHPQVLSDEQIASIRDRMSKAGRVHEHRLALERLVKREQKIAAELRQLSHVIHQFHQIARTERPDAPEYKRAELNYLKAVREVTSHDGEWLSAMILELLDILGDWTHPPPRVEAQLDHFVASIRSSLSHIRTEIQQIESQRKSS